MVDLGCQVIDWVGRNDREGLDANLLLDGLILATECGERKMWLSWVHFWLFWGPEGGP